MDIATMMSNLSEAYDRLQQLEVRASRNNILILEFVQRTMQQTFRGLDELKQQTQSEAVNDNGSV